MHKNIGLNTKSLARKIRERKVLKEELKNEEPSLVDSLHKWGEDYYGAEDYYEKTVNSLPQTNHYNDYQKKTDKQ